MVGCVCVYVGGVMTRHAGHSTLATFNVLFRCRADWMPLMSTKLWTLC